MRALEQMKMREGTVGSSVGILDLRVCVDESNCISVMCMD
jgi:hypothetical protein